MIRRPPVREALVAFASGGAALAALRLLERRPPGGPQRWSRTNFAGRDVHLLAGPAAGVGAITAAALAGTSRAATARTVALVTTAGGLGLYDDLAGQTHARGLRGHLASLQRGEVTTGVVKMTGLVLAAAAAAPGVERRPPLGRLLDVALISGTANLVNLLDLRPGRALKVVSLVALPLAAGRGVGRSAATGILAVSAVLSPGDLRERHMIGDCGANAVGALLGWTLATGPDPSRRRLALGVVVALTLVSERVSFSAVIDRHPVLAALDGVGRRRA